MTARLPHVAGRCQPGTGLNMWTSLLIIALAAAQLPQLFGDQIHELGELVEEAAGLDRARDLELLSSFLELGAQVETLKNATSQLLKELDSVRSRQAVAGAIQGAQVFLFLAYLATIAVCYLVKRCRKHQKEIAKAEFELLETKLQASRSRRRAAAAARTNKQTPQ